MDFLLPGVDVLRIPVVDDSDAVRHGRISLLASEPNWTVAGEAEDGIDAASKAQQLKPDVVLLDISLPRVNGLVAAQVIRRLVPDAEIIFVSQHSSRGFVEEAFKVGARGYLCKADLASQLLDAVRAVKPTRDIPELQLLCAPSCRHGNAMAESQPSD